MGLTGPDAARAVVITGAGSSFCAGADLRAVYDEAFRDALYAMLAAVTGVPVPVLAAVNGPAIGAGAQLALACDLRVAAPEATFAIPTARLGIAVNPWTIRRLALLAGTGTAQAVLVGGETLDTAAALRCGLVSMGSGTATRPWPGPRELAGLAPLSLAYAKKALNEPDSASAGQGLRGLLDQRGRRRGPARPRGQAPAQVPGALAVKPAPFDYVRARCIQDAVAALAAANEEGEGKIIAGGQSLMPLLALRLAQPSVLVDINRVPGLDAISPGPGGGLRIGALTRHRALAAQRQHPLLAEAARWVGHAAIRTRGTLGGSLAHADPAAELPVVAVASGAVATVAGPAGNAKIPADGPVHRRAADQPGRRRGYRGGAVPAPGPRWGFAEFARRHGDFGLVVVAAAEVDGRLRLALGGVASTPVRPASAEAVLAGGPLGPSADRRGR